MLERRQQHHKLATETIMYWPKKVVEGSEEGQLVMRQQNRC